MPHADPDIRAAYNRERWQTHGAIYRASRTPAPPPISRSQLLAEDIAQAKALEAIETRRVGARRAAQRFADWLKGERAWLGVGSTYVIEGLDGRDR